MKINAPVIVAALLLLNLPLSTAFAQGTAFTYQGRLQSTGSAANGGYDFQFTLYATNTAGVAVAGPVTNLDVQVTNGLFTTTIDFGPGVFIGASNWLNIAVETNGVGPFTELTPRQQLTPVPYAQFAERANAGGLSGTLNLPTPEITSGGAVILDSTNSNFFVGMAAGNSAGDNGAQNTAVGNQALYSNTSGYYNTANGARALYSNTDGGQNTANGYQALYYNTSGSDNTANGLETLYNNTSGSGNLADGFEALYLNTSGSENVAVGSWALLSDETGSNNTAIGISALIDDFGSDNIALGYGAGSAYQQAESSNIDIGNIGVPGDNNIIRIGTPGVQTNAWIAGTIYGNGGGLTNLNAAQLSGPLSLAQLPAGIVTNNESGVTLTNLTVGASLNLPAAEITSGSSTLLFGNAGNGNFFAGQSAGNVAADTGSYNMAAGTQALGYNQTGSGNTASGFEALFDGTTGSYNTADGFEALDFDGAGANNTAVGASALQVSSGSQNTAVGVYALNVLHGGSYNIALGYDAGSSFTATESQNIEIGNNGVSGENNIIRIGTPGVQTNAFIAGTIYGNGGGLTNLNAAQLTGSLSLAQLPASVVTDNESGVTLNGLTVSGTVSANSVSATSVSVNSATLTGALNLNSGEINYESSTLMYTPSPPGNFFVGPEAGGGFLSGVTGSFNTGLGYAALLSNGGADNTACGYEALVDNIGSYNTASGYTALLANTNSYNTAIGYAALNIAVGGFENTAAGANALNRIKSGTNNIAVGYNAGSSFTTNESQNIDIGNNGVAGDNYIVRIGTIQSATYLAGTVYANNVALTSDRNAKENFRTLDARTVLAKVAALPITEWNYKTSQNLEHIGPMAQDFHAAFGLNGSDDKHISEVDEGGVALAAIQGLNEKLEEQSAENAKLKQENSSLAERLDELEAQVKALSGNKQ